MAILSFFSFWSHCASIPQQFFALETQFRFLDSYHRPESQVATQRAYYQAFNYSTWKYVRLPSV